MWRPGLRGSGRYQAARTAQTVRTGVERLKRGPAHAVAVVGSSSICEPTAHNMGAHLIRRRGDPFPGDRGSPLLSKASLPLPDLTGVLECTYKGVENPNPEGSGPYPYFVFIS